MYIDLRIEIERKEDAPRYLDAEEIRQFIEDHLGDLTKHDSEILWRSNRVQFLVLTTE